MSLESLVPDSKLKSIWWVFGTFFFLFLLLLFLFFLHTLSLHAIRCNCDSKTGVEPEIFLEELLCKNNFMRWPYAKLHNIFLNPKVFSSERLKNLFNGHDSVCQLVEWVDIDGFFLFKGNIYIKTRKIKLETETPTFKTQPGRPSDHS